MSGKNSRNLEYVNKIKEAILKKMGNSDSTTLHMKDTGDDIIIARNSEGYTMYNGCELICGDTSLRFISMLIADNAVRPY
jgi:hypothetical protein